MKTKILLILYLKWIIWKKKMITNIFNHNAIFHNRKYFAMNGLNQELIISIKTGNNKMLNGIFNSLFSEIGL